MARIAQELELVAMKAIVHVGEQMQQRHGGCDTNDDGKIDAAGKRIFISV